MKRHYFILLCMVMVSSLWGQAPTLVFERPDGIHLADREMFSLYQDREGQLWIGTYSGLHKWDGEQLESFKTGPQELITWPWAMEDDRHGGFWVAAGINRLYHYDSAIGRFSGVPYQRQIDSLVNSGQAELQCIAMTDDTTLMMCTGRGTLMCHPGKGTLKLLTPEEEGVKADFYFEAFQGGVVLQTGPAIYNKQAVKRIQEEGAMTVSVKWEGRHHLLKLPANKGHFPMNRVKGKVLRDGSLVAHMGRMLFFLRPDGSYWHHTLSWNAICMLVDSKENIWVGLRHKGMSCFTRESNYRESRSYMDGHIITGIVEDHEGGMWVTSQDVGVFYCNSQQVWHYPTVPDLQGNLYTAWVGPNVLHFSSMDGRFARVTPRGAEVVMVEGLTRIPLAMALTGKNVYLSTSDGAFMCDTAYRNLREVLDQDNQYKFAGRIASAIGRDSALMGNRMNMHLVTAGKGRTVFKPNDQVAYLTVGADSCLYVNFANKDTAYRLTKGLTLEPFPVPRSTLMVVNPGKGMRCYLAGDKLYLDAPQWSGELMGALGLKVNRVNDVLHDPATGLWIGTSQGLIHLMNDLTYEMLTEEDGLPPGSINRVLRMGSRIFLVTESGLRVIPTDFRKHEVKPRFSLSYTEVEGEARHLRNDTLFLNPREHNVRMVFRLFTFKAQQASMRMQYRVREFGGDWASTGLREVMLNNLSSSTYHLQVRVAPHQGYLQSDVISFVIVAKPPFWRTVWFNLLLAGLGLGLVILIIRANGQRIRRKEEEKTRINKLIAESQMSALQAHMNPHFIFNVINSIQADVLDNDSQAAYDNLTKFSRLVRSVLEHARQRTIPLSKELDLLANYVDLEQMRFRDVFTYQVLVAQGIQPEVVQVPAMLLQPYVENAIVHGLAPLGKAGGGLLQVSISRTENGLHIHIQDNGVGRKRSAEMRQNHDHKSIGMSIGEERLEALRHLPGYQNAAVQVRDAEPGGERPGTWVEITLPYSTA